MDQPNEYSLALDFARQQLTETQSSILSEEVYLLELREKLKRLRHVVMVLEGIVNGTESVR